MIKIGFEGVQSGGKSTVWTNVWASLKLAKKKVEAVPEVARLAIDLGFKLDEGIDPASQMWMLGRQIALEVEAERKNPDFVLCDRTIYAPVVYTAIKLWKGITTLQYSQLCHIATAFARLHPYNLVFRFPPLPEGIHDDGVRNANPGFQAKIQEAMERVLPSFTVQLYDVEGKTREERVTEVLGVIRKRFAGDEELR